MNSHLSEAQISGWMVGDRPWDLEQHVLMCPACRDSVTRFEAALVQFRTSVRQWSHEQFDPASQVRMGRRDAGWWLTFQRVYGAVAVLAILGCAILSLLHTGRQAPAPEILSADANLMTQVHQAVSRTVPGPMEPLMQLVSWDGRTSSEPVAKEQP